MKLLFATDRLHVPDDRSGSVQSTHALVTQLVLRGHDCIVLASLPRSGRHFAATLAHRIIGRRGVLTWTDTRNGYPVTRGSEWRFAERVQSAIRRVMPDALVLDSLRQLRILTQAGVSLPDPTVVSVCDLRFKGEARIPLPAGVVLLANSPATARALSDHFGTPARVVPPLIAIDDYVSDTRSAQYLTLVSPNERKGLSTALEMAAAMPDERFLFVEGWPMGREEWRALQSRLLSHPNVSVERSCSDMRQVYARTKLLIVPSFVHETFGRVVIEANASGIPVIARNVGALEYTVGEGGILMDEHSDGRDWALAARELLADRKRYDGLRILARTNAQRPEFAPTNVVDRFLLAILDFVAS